MCPQSAFPFVDATRELIHLQLLYPKSGQPGFGPNAVLMFGDDARLAMLFNDRQSVLEVVLIPRRSAAAFYSRHKCVCFSLEFNSDELID